MPSFVVRLREEPKLYVCEYELGPYDCVCHSTPNGPHCARPLRDPDEEEAEGFRSPGAADDADDADCDPSAFALPLGPPALKPVTAEKMREMALAASNVAPPPALYDDDEAVGGVAAPVGLAGSGNPGSCARTMAWLSVYEVKMDDPLSHARTYLFDEFAAAIGTSRIGLHQGPHLHVALMAEMKRRWHGRHGAEGGRRSEAFRGAEL